MQNENVGPVTIGYLGKKDDEHARLWCNPTVQHSATVPKSATEVLQKTTVKRQAITIGSDLFMNQRSHSLWHFKTFMI